MDKLFICVLNMSLTASYVILFVILVRLLLKKAPTVISYALWGIVAFRLIIPVSFESVYSLIPRDMDRILISDYNVLQSAQMDNSADVPDTFLSHSFAVSDGRESTNQLQIMTEAGAYIWLTGVIVLLGYSMIASFNLSRKLKGARLIESNIYEMEKLKTPFVFGITRPKIYLPVSISSEERNFVILHEQTHIDRKDHITKVIAFLILSIHWFNPLVWISYTLMSIDMELSCDEHVLKEMNEDIRKPYANLLLSLAVGKHMLNSSPPAFGEGNVKRRMKNVLSYKKPTRWIVIISLIAVIILGAGLMANPIKMRNTYVNLMSSTQTYHPYSVVYLNPMYSVTADKFLDDNKTNEYQFHEDVFRITSSSGNIEIKNPVYKKEQLGDEIIVLEGLSSLDISGYDKKEGFRVLTSDGIDSGYSIYMMDDDVWVSHGGWYGDKKDVWWCEYILKVIK